MKTIKIPYYKGTLDLNITDENLKAVVFPNKVETSETDEKILVREALQSPNNSRKLSELAKGKNKVVIVTSDHTRSVPSKITLPLILEEIRSGNPEAEITILIATGLHRETTVEEQKQMFGEELVKKEYFISNNALKKEDFVNLGKLPSGAELHVNRLAVDCDLLITEGFIEPHFFAGFSGGRKSILPGICDKVTICQNHSYKAISHPNSTTGVLDGNPIHKDMVFAAKKVNVQFVLNVALDDKKRIVKAFAGDLESAHEAGVQFVKKNAQKKIITGDIVVTSNGGYPLDQNLYQSPKAVSTAMAFAGDDGIIILSCSCCDGVGGENFERLISMGTPEEIDQYLSEIPDTDTIPEQWCAQIYSKILRKHKVILVSDYLSPAFVKKCNMIPAADLNEAMNIAYTIKGEKAKVIVVPDGVSVLAIQEKEEKIAVQVSDLDNVATIFSKNIKGGDRVTVTNKHGKNTFIKANMEIPYGHKIAVQAIKKGSLIIKYGEEIGIATTDIATGDYVHVHNLDSMRGRGDWK